MLAEQRGSTAAFAAARALRCGVCERLRRPGEARPTAMPRSRGFQGRLLMGFLYLHDIRGEKWCIMSLVDDGTIFHVTWLMAET
eukprot:4484096-Alexandrium_andersonii.AAC.1